MTPDAMAALYRVAMPESRPWPAEEFAELLARPHTHLTHRPGGFALWQAVAGEAELLTIVVDPARQGQRIGTGLMQDWMTQAALTCDQAILEVATDNAPALALYAAFGFETVARRPDYYRRANGAVDALLQRAPLPPKL